MKGIVFDEGGLSVVDDLSVRDLRADEVRVDIQAAGVCHSDVSVIDGTIPFPTPVVLGHEGVGHRQPRSARPSPGVAVGDHVVISTLSNCGACAACDSGQPDALPARRSARCRRRSARATARCSSSPTSAPSREQTIVKARQAVPINKDVPFEVASLLGCGVITGVGAVFNRAKVTHGQSVAGHRRRRHRPQRDPGCGARRRRCRSSPSTPTRRRRRWPGSSAPPTSSTPPRSTPLEAIKEICPNGVDFSFECVGHPALIRQSIDMLDWGGTCVILGVPKFGTEASFLVSGMYNDKTIMGCRYGAGRPHKDIPLFVDLYLAGRLKLDELVTQDLRPRRHPADARRHAQRRPRPRRAPDRLTRRHGPSRRAAGAGREGLATGVGGATTTSGARRT